MATIEVATDRHGSIDTELNFARHRARGGAYIRDPGPIRWGKRAGESVCAQRIILVHQRGFADADFDSRWRRIAA